MKRRYVFAAVAAAAVCMGMQAEKLVLVHTNDTHSQIDPNDKGLGGIARRAGHAVLYPLWWRSGDEDDERAGL